MNKYIIPYARVDYLSNNDNEIKSLIANFDQMIGLIMGIVFAIIASAGVLYISWIGFKMAKAEDEVQRNEMKKNLIWKIKIFLLIIVIVASFSAILAFAQKYMGMRG